MNLVLQLALVLWSTPKLRLQTISGRTRLLMSSCSDTESTAATVVKIPPPGGLPWLDIEGLNDLNHLISNNLTMCNTYSMFLTCIRSRRDSPVVAWMIALSCGWGTMLSPSTKTPELHFCLERTMSWCSRCVFLFFRGYMFTFYETREHLIYTYYVEIVFIGIGKIW